MDDAPLLIAFFSPDLPDSGAINGIVTYSRIMRDALRSLGHSVSIVTADCIEHPDGSVAALPRPNRIMGRLRWLRESRRTEDGSDPWVRLRILDAFRAARRAGAQVFEIEESFGWAGRLTGQGIPIVERLHGPHAFVRDEIESTEQTRVGDMREAAELASLRRVQAVTGPTRRLLDALIDRYELRLPIARVIPNPIPVASSALSWRSDGADPDQILFVGRFDRCKGADLAIQAFARALERRPSLKLVMAGPDRGLAQPNGSMVKFAEFVTKEVSPEARARIEFLGALPPDRISALRLQSGFSLVGSRFENFAYSIAEPMAVGMPVLTSDTFGGSEMVRDGIDGLVVPIGDVDRIADAILTMAGDPGRLAQMGQSAQRRVVEWLSPERIARETVAVYREAMAPISAAAWA